MKFKKKILQNSQKISKKNGVKFTKIQKKNIVWVSKRFSYLFYQKYKYSQQVDFDNHSILTIFRYRIISFLGIKKIKYNFDNNFENIWQYNFYKKPTKYFSWSDKLSFKK